MGDEYVFNVRGYFASVGATPTTILSPRSGAGIQTTTFNAYVIPAVMPTLPGTISPIYDSTVLGFYNGVISFGFIGEIYAGAKITITVNQGIGCSTSIDGSTITVLPIASRNYQSFEEFFWQECANVTIGGLGGTINKNRYAFRYVNTQLNLSGGVVGRSTWINNPNSNQSGVSAFRSELFLPTIMSFHTCNGTSFFSCSATLEQAVSPTYIVETVPLDVETPIFHETMRTYPIVGGFHKVGWQYSSNTEPSPLQYVLQSSYFHYFQVGQSITINSIPGTVTNVFNGNSIRVLMLSAIPVGSGIVLMEGEADQSSITSNATIILNNISENTDFNAFCYGNGLESYRIRDSFNNSTMKYSIRASTVIEDYEQEDKFASLTYSGIFSW